MLHPDLKVFDKPVASEEELKTYLENEDLVYTIGDFSLDVSKADFFKPLSIIWADQTSRVLYSLKSPADYREDPLAILFEDSSSSCYDDEDIWQIILYFCQTGRPHPGYPWSRTRC